MNTEAGYITRCLQLRRAHCKEFKELIYDLILSRQLLASKHLEERVLLQKSIHYCTELAKLIVQQVSEIAERMYVNNHKKQCLRIQQKIEMDALEATLIKKEAFSYQNY